MSYCHHTDEDAAILRRVDRTNACRRSDVLDSLRMHADVDTRGAHNTLNRMRCLAATGLRGQEWMDLIDEMIADALAQERLA